MEENIYMRSPNEDANANAIEIGKEEERARWALTCSMRELRSAYAGICQYIEKAPIRGKGKNDFVDQMKARIAAVESGKQAMRDLQILFSWINYPENNRYYSEDPTL